MTVLRRGTAILAALLTFQLVLIGSAVRSDAHGSERAAAAISHATLAPASHPVDAPCHAPAADDHCFPSASEHACDAMALCVASVFTVEAIDAPLASALRQHVAGEPAPEHPTRTTTPELPPPRL